jgi:hypothetical protein
MHCIVKDKEGKKITQFTIQMPFVKKMAKKLGISYQTYLAELAKIKVEEKKEQRKKQNDA